MSDDAIRDDTQAPRPISPGDFAGLPGFPPAVPVPLRATGTDGRPVSAYRLRRLAQEGKITPSRSLADVIAEIQAAKTAGSAAPRPRPSCQLCNDAGYVVADAKYGEPDFGTLIPCSCKEQERRAQRARAALRIGSLYKHRAQTFATFEADATPSIFQAFDAAVRFAEQPEGFLVLVGPMGTGKTHLAAAIANQRLDAGDEVVFVVVPDMLDRFRRTFHPDSTERYDELFEQVRDCALLVLDDIGTENPTPWANEKLYQLVGHRYALRLPTVFTTNQAPEKIDARIISRGDERLFGRRPWVMLGPDWRRREADVSWASIDPAIVGLQYGSRGTVPVNPYDRGEQASVYDSGEKEKKDA